MTTAQNNQSIPGRVLPQSLPVTSDITINQGDLVWWDPTNLTLKPLSAASQVANQFVGVASGSSPALLYPGDSPTPALPVETDACVFLYVTNGETYSHFDDVTIGADAQTITKAGATTANRVGFIILDPPSTARAPVATPIGEQVAGVTGNRIRVQLEPKHKAAVTL